MEFLGFFWALYFVDVGLWEGFVAVDWGWMMWFRGRMTRVINGSKGMTDKLSLSVTGRSRPYFTPCCNDARLTGFTDSGRHCVPGLLLLSTIVCIMDLFPFLTVNGDRLGYLDAVCFAFH